VGHLAHFFFKSVFVYLRAATGGWTSSPPLSPGLPPFPLPCKSKNERCLRSFLPLCAAFSPPLFKMNVSIERIRMSSPYDCASLPLAQRQTTRSRRRTALLSIRGDIPPLFLPRGFGVHVTRTRRQCARSSASLRTQGSPNLKSHRTEFPP